MDCNEFDRLFDDYLNGELSPAATAGFQAHSIGCPECSLKHSEAITLRNRLRSEFVPEDPEGLDSFHSFRREIAVRENATQNRRRFFTVRALGFASVIILLMGYLLINVPVSYSLPDGMSIVINFDPPLADAPEFEGLILPREFYDEVASSEDVLIESFTTVQGPDGLTKIELEISKDDPEIAAKVYETLVKNYPALEAGEVTYHGIEEEKREPFHVMLRDWHKSDDILSDEEIMKVIILKTPEIDQWIDEEMMPLVKGIEIRIGGDGGGLSIEELMERCEVKILKIDAGDEIDEHGTVMKQFKIIISDDGEYNGGITKDLCIQVQGPCGPDGDLLSDDVLKKIQIGEIASDEFEQIVIKAMRIGVEDATGKIIIKGGGFGAMLDDSVSKMTINIDDELLRKFTEGEITEEEFEEAIKEQVCGDIEGADVEVKILRLEDGKLELGDHPFKIMAFHDKELQGDLEEIMMELEIELGGLEMDLEELEACLRTLKASGKLDQYGCREKLSGIFEVEMHMGLPGEGFFEDISDLLGDCLIFDGSEFKSLGDDSLTMKLDVFTEEDGSCIMMGGEGFEYDEIVTPEELEALKNGELTSDELEKIVKDRLEEKGIIGDQITICIVGEDGVFTLKVEEDDVEINYESVE